MRHLLLTFLCLPFVASAARRPNGSPYDTFPVFFQQLLRKEMPSYELYEKLNRIISYCEPEFQTARELSLEKRELLRKIELISLDFETPAVIRLRQINKLMREANVTADNESIFYKRTEYDMSSKFRHAKNTPLLAKEFYKRIMNVFFSEKYLNEPTEGRVEMLWHVVCQFQEDIEIHSMFQEEMRKVRDHVSGKKKLPHIRV